MRVVRFSTPFVFKLNDDSKLIMEKYRSTTSIDSLDILETYCFDMFPLATEIEARLAPLLRPLPERIYIGADLEGIDLNRDYYFMQTGRERVRVRSLQDIVLPVYRQDGDDVTGIVRPVITSWHLRNKSVTDTPRGPKRGIAILSDYVKYFVDRMLPHCRGHDFITSLDKHILLTPRNSPRAFEYSNTDDDSDRLYCEKDAIKCDIEQIIENLLTNINRFVGSYRDHLYFIKRDKTFMLIQRSIDHRAWNWLQLQAREQGYD